MRDPTTNWRSQSTLDYYQHRARDYFDRSFDSDLSSSRHQFLSRLPANAIILDAGCGSGRDALAFHQLGHRVHAFDACAALAELARLNTALPIQVRSFDDVNEVAVYDGIWACASLLHVALADLPATFVRLWTALKPSGTLFVSFKHVGPNADDDVKERLEAPSGRWFTDATPDALRRWLVEALPGAGAFHCWETEDAQGRSGVRWVSALVTKAPVEARQLITGGAASPFLPHLRTAIQEATEIDIAVAFVKTAGLRLLLSELLDALTRHCPARLRFLTSDYLDVTDPEALRLLQLLAERGAFVRVFDTRTGPDSYSFHMKAYIFATFHREDGRLEGRAFIGSSNLSRQALYSAGGLEWNYRVDFPGDPGYLEARNRFEELFAHPRTLPLTDSWIAEYERRRGVAVREIEPGSNDREPPPVPNTVQLAALAALDRTREEGYRRGLVVLATGLGKTWLAAFDSDRFQAKRVLFVAHREEILAQAAETFQRIRPRATVGTYAGTKRDTSVEILCASVQTLSRPNHLERFKPDAFDYIVIDEFHHAAAATYRRLLAHFTPRFLLGLTATPDRTDQADICSLCDDNVVYEHGLFAGVRDRLLVPFDYYGIYDTEVDYREIPWRNGRFDPEQLSSRLATLARAQHAWDRWQQHKQERTLAFCVSIRHADFMANEFARRGARAASVHGASTVTRRDALDQLAAGKLDIVFSVDLFSEGVDLPQIDTVLLLRPTESRILFLQQIGRGLRKADGKQRLVILDFIGNHRSFLANPRALLGINPWQPQELANFVRQLQTGKLELPDGCFVNYDLALIDFLAALAGQASAADPEQQYVSLREVMGRRPTLLEFFHAGANLERLRRGWRSWAGFLAAQGDLLLPPRLIDFLAEVETTAMTKSFKMVLLEAFQELDGWERAPLLITLAAKSWDVLQRRRPLLGDLPPAMRRTSQPAAWERYWRENPVQAWTSERASFQIIDGTFTPNFSVAPEDVEVFSSIVQELIDMRLASYLARSSRTQPSDDNVVSIDQRRATPVAGVSLPYFPDLQIACGHFKTGRTDSNEYRVLGSEYGRLNAARHFIARATGDSMNGGAHPIHDGDYLLLEHITPTSAGSLNGSTVVIEREDSSGDNQYLLRSVLKNRAGQHVLRANNPDRSRYPDVTAEEGFRTVARWKATIDPLEMMIGEAFPRERIPSLFGEDFNQGRWHSGAVPVPGRNALVLLVSLDKRGRQTEHRYQDHWIDQSTFHWQSQNSNSPENKRGRDIIEHASRGIHLHLFVRESRLAGGKGAPFVYYGLVDYVSHTGSKPMSVTLRLRVPRAL